MGAGGGGTVAHRGQYRGGGGGLGWGGVEMNEQQGILGVAPRGGGGGWDGRRAWGVETQPKVLWGSRLNMVAFNESHVPTTGGLDG